jgi:hypothetical protein
VRRYLLLDANVTIDYFVPDPANRPCPDRIQTIVEAVRNRAVDEVVLLVPNICIPEVFGAFAKHTLGGSWNPKSLKLDRRRHETVRNGFRTYLHNGAVFHQYELDRYHVLATDLITPVDHWFQIRRGKKARRIPMGGIDHLVIAMGIVLARLNGQPNVAILTTDLRSLRPRSATPMVRTNVLEGSGSNAITAPTTTRIANARGRIPARAVATPNRAHPIASTR